MEYNNIEFLTRISNKRLRKEICNICDSYTHPWDIVAELSQNAVDAINKYNLKYGNNSRNHEIIVEIDCLQRKIRMRDTGVGLELNNLAECLAPHGTDKDGDNASIGEKGVGLTFAVFSAMNIEVSSINSIGSYVAHIESASIWKNGLVGCDHIPTARVSEVNEVKSYKPQDFYTEILLNNVEKIYNDSIDIFHISLNRLIFLLQTKTALGYLNYLWKVDHPQIKIKLIHTSLDGNRTETDLEFKYRLPSSFLNSNDVINYDSFVQQAASMSDMQKSSRLRGKCLELDGKVERAGRTIKYYAFYAPSRLLWKTIASQNGLLIPENDGMDPELKGGIFLCTKGMPTSVELVPPISGASGYWANLFILIEDNALSFDLGRKSIPGPTQSMYKGIAADLFTKLTAYSKYISTDPASSQQISTIQQAQKNQTFSSLEKLNDLGINSINYLKYPDGQEASVVAIFHELIGAGKLKGYYSLKHGYKLTYDFWGKYIISSKELGSKFNDMDSIEIPIVIEFKYNAQDIIEDVDKNTKFFIDMDLIVCWDIDPIKFNNRNIQVRLLNKDEVFFHGSNYELIWPGAYNLGSASQKPVLCLRRLIEDMAANE